MTLFQRDPAEVMKYLDLKFLKDRTVGDEGASNDAGGFSDAADVMKKRVT